MVAQLRAVRIMGFGAGVLISAVAFDLVEEAVEEVVRHTGAAIAGLFAGCVVFFGGDRLIDRHGGGDRKDATGAQKERLAARHRARHRARRHPGVDGDRADDLRGWRRRRGLSGCGVHLQPARGDLVDGRAGRPAAGRSRGSSGCGSRSRVVSGLASLAGYGLFENSSPDTSPSCSPSPQARSSRCSRTRPPTARRMSVRCSRSRPRSRAGGEVSREKRAGDRIAVRSAGCVCRRAGGDVRRPDGRAPAARCWPTGSGRSSNAWPWRPTRESIGRGRSYAQASRRQQESWDAACAAFAAWKSAAGSGQSA